MSENEPGPHKHPKTRSNWNNEILFAQRITHYKFHVDNGEPVSMERIPYAGIGLPRGGECHDCLASAGMLHVPGCEEEQCPRCSSRATTCGCVHVETWHQLPVPDKDVPWNGQVVQPIVTYANGLVQLDRFHIIEFNKCYLILIKSDPDKNEYIVTPFIFPAALRALIISIPPFTE